jgi:hypothetical protein
VVHFFSHSKFFPLQLGFVFSMKQIYLSLSRPVVLLPVRLVGDEAKEDEMGRVYSTYG